MELDTSKYFLEAARLIDEQVAEPEYVSATVDDIPSIGPEDALEDIFAEFRENEAQNKTKERAETLSKAAQLHQFPPTVDEFFRSFLLRNQFTSTLNAFQIEWFQKLHQGKLDTDRLESVPHVYEQNEQLSDKLSRLQNENEALRTKLESADALVKKIKNERDYHMLKHRRLIQEKDQLIAELKRIRTHYAEYEPLLRQLQHRYELAMKEKTLNRVERDRAIGQAEGLRSALTSLQKLGLSASDSLERKPGLQPLQGTARAMQPLENTEPIRNVKKVGSGSVNRAQNRLGGGLVELPADRKVNPLLTRIRAGSPGLSRLASKKLNENIRAHESPCTNVTVHTDQPWLCTTGDDKSWKLWCTRTMSPVMHKSEAHDSWLSSADFHPTDKLLATAGGEGTVQIWQFEPNLDEPSVEEVNSTVNQPRTATPLGEPKRLSVLKHHTGAVWSVHWHWDGRILASAGLDNTICLWDVTTARTESGAKTNSCRATLRQHCGSVNSVRFLPFGNILVTASTDRSVLLWDARTGIKVHSFLGHQSSVSHAVFNQQGTCIASCDSSGVVRFWDLRQCSTVGGLMLSESDGSSSFICATPSLDLAKGRKKRLPLSVNQVAYDLSGDYLAAACSDGRVCYIEVSTGQVSSLYAHEDAVQSVAFDFNSEVLYSVSNDGRLCSWN